MSERDPIEETPPGAQVALPIAQEHLIVNLNSIDAVDSRAMSLMAFNLAAMVAGTWGSTGEKFRSSRCR